MAAYGDWVPIEKTADKAQVPAKKVVPNVPTVMSTVPSGETTSDSGLLDAVEQQPAPIPDSDSVFPETLQQVRPTLIELLRKSL